MIMVLGPSTRDFAPTRTLRKPVWYKDATCTRLDFSLDQVGQEVVGCWVASRILLGGPGQAGESIEPIAAFCVPHPIHANPVAVWDECCSRPNVLFCGCLSLLNPVAQRSMFTRWETRTTYRK